MKKKMISHVVFLRPESLAPFSALEGPMLRKDGSIRCCTIDESHHHYLQVEARAGAIHGEGKWIHLSINHSAVLYIFSDLTVADNKFLGFEGLANKNNTQSK